MAAAVAVPVQVVTVEGIDNASNPFKKEMRIVSLLDRRANAPTTPLRWLLQVDLEDLLYPAVVTQGTNGAFYRLLKRSAITFTLTWAFTADH